MSDQLKNDLKQLQGELEYALRLAVAAYASANAAAADAEPGDGIDHEVPVARVARCMAAISVAMFDLRGGRP